MEDLIQEITTKESKSTNKKASQPHLLKLFLGISLCLIIFAVLKYEDVVDEYPNGTVQLKPEREDEYKDKVGRYNFCTQYALVASQNGFYPCLNCPNGQDSIYLYKGEVWKYGYTCENDVYLNRYQGKLPIPNLDVFPQFMGTIQQCKTEELHKIFYYPLLPENQKRKKEERLVRPAGNPYDA